MLNFSVASIKEELEQISSDVLNGINYKRNDYARSIINYPAMMVPSVQEPIINCLAKSFNNARLLDPFMGASNTLVAGMKYGLNVYGQDINPLSLLISIVKTSYFASEKLNLSANELEKRYLSDNNIEVEVNFTNIDKWFGHNIQIELSKLRRAIQQEEDTTIRRFYWVTLAEVIRLSSNDRTSTFKLHQRSIEEIKQRKISAGVNFFTILKRSIIDVTSFCQILSGKNLIINGKYCNSTKVVWGNTAKSINIEETIDLIVTSPPYGDNHTTVTYGQFSYLPLQWIPISDIDDKIPYDYLKTTQEIDTNSLGGSFTKEVNSYKEELFDKAPTLKQLFDSYDDDSRIKARKVLQFFKDLDESIDNIHKKLSRESFLVWTIGNRNVNGTIVRNDLILTELLASKKVDLISILDRDILSKRMPDRNNFSNTMSKEKILIFKYAS